MTAQQTVSPVQQALGIPIDYVNEQVLIVAACLDTKTRKGLTQRLKPDGFILDKHRVIWEGLTEIARKDLDFDTSTLREVTGGKADTEYVSIIVKERHGPPPNLKHHARRFLEERAKIDCVQGPLSLFLKALQDPTTSVEKLKTIARSIATSLESSGAYQPVDPNLLNNEAEAVLDMFAKTSYPFGLVGLDNYENGSKRLKPGLMPGMTSIITACSGCGKSSVLAHIALIQGPGLRKPEIPGLGRHIMYGAFEMPPEMLINQFAALSLGISRNKMFDGVLSEKERKDIAEERVRIEEWIKFYPQPVGKKGTALNSEETLDSIYGMLSDSMCEVAILDLWERPFQFRSEAEEKAALVRQQEMAKELKISCILAAQQKLKEVEQRPDKRPARDTIKGSSAWVDVGDTTLGVNLPSRWKDVPNDRIEIIILKQRYGLWPLLVDFEYNAETGLITNGKSAPYRTVTNDIDATLQRAIEMGR